MIGLQIINKKYKPRHVGFYCSLRPWDIVTKFTQKLTGLINYYYEFLTYPSDLSFYYYALKYSCLKTLAHRMKKSISQILKIYGEKIKMTITKKDKVEKLRHAKFPRYMEIMDQIGERIILKRKIKKSNETKMKDLLKNDKFETHDPLI